MEKKPVNFVVHDAREAVRELNELVEKGAATFDVGVNEEYVYTVTRKSDGSTEKEKEKVFRVIGFAEMMVGHELDSLNEIKEERNAVKKERQELNRTLNVMNKSAFAPISIFLLIIAVITLVLGVLTLAKVLPLPAEQIAISVVLTVVGALALAGSFLLFFFRRKKKLALLAKKDEILKQDSDLKAREADVDLKTPQWYKNALWSQDGNVAKNFNTRLTFNK